MKAYCLSRHIAVIFIAYNVYLRRRKHLTNLFPSSSLSLPAKGTDSSHGGNSLFPLRELTVPFFGTSSNY